MGGEVTAVEGFQFESAPVAFPGGVVVAVGFPTHGGHQAGLVQGAAVIGPGVWAAATGVEQ